MQIRVFDSVFLGMANALWAFGLLVCDLFICIRLLLKTSRRYLVSSQRGSQLHPARAVCIMHYFYFVLLVEPCCGRYSYFIIALHINGGNENPGNQICEVLILMNKNRSRIHTFRQVDGQLIDCSSTALVLYFFPRPTSV